MGSWWTSGKATSGWPVPTTKLEGIALYDTALLKSALQKFIRKGIRGLALSCGQAMIDRGELKSLARRLPAIAVEDCGFRKSWIATHCSTVEGEDVPMTLLKVIDVLCEGVHDKSAEPLMATARMTNKANGPADVMKLADALKAGDIEYACRCAVAEMDPSENATSASPMWLQILSAVPRPSPMYESIVNVIQALKKRIADGMFASDRSMCAVACCQLAAGRRYSADSPSWTWEAKEDWLTRTPETPQKLFSLVDHWAVFDPHTFLGKCAAAHFAKKHGIPRLWTSWAWFVAESGRVEPALDSEYLKVYDLQVREMFGGESLEQMTTKWMAVRSEYEDFMRSLMRSRGL